MYLGSNFNSDAYNTQFFASADNVLNHYYERYAAEIASLWQHSTFCWTFEALLLTGYGTVLFQMFSAEGGFAKSPLHPIAVILGLAGLCVSVIWIALAKSSRSWQQYYEKLIVRFENSGHFPLGEHYAMGGDDITIPDADLNLFTQTPGRFSKGKLNVFTAQFVWIIWLVIALVHSGFYLYDFKIYKPITILVIFAIHLAFVCLMRSKCASSSIDSEKKE